MPQNPLAEVFGFPVSDMSPEAINHRLDRLCPFGNPSGPRCTKVSAIDPIGVCSVWDGENLAVTCPVRLRQDDLMLSDAADFFFPGQRYVALSEVRLKDGDSKSAGNIDVVLAVLDSQGGVVDFGAIEVQSVYITGNVSAPFRAYMEDPASQWNMPWPQQNYPSPDYLSSSRKRLAPQLWFKGGILHAWNKRMAVVVHRAFFDRLPQLEATEVAEADIAWIVYDLEQIDATGRFQLIKSEVRYTQFASALNAITISKVGDVGDFVRNLEGRISAGRFHEQPMPTSLEPTAEPPTGGC